MQRLTTFENDYFLCEKCEDGTTIVTVLKDEYNFFGISLENCKLICTQQGYINDKFTLETLAEIKKYSTQHNISEHDLALELRCRILNVLISMI